MSFSQKSEETIVHQALAVEAQVTVRPLVQAGQPKLTSTKSVVRAGKGGRPLKKAETCTFTVTQVIHVAIPISFSVEVDVDQGIVNCGPPSVEPCTIRLRRPERFTRHQHSEE